MSREQHQRAFVLQVEQASLSPASISGRVEHIATGRASTFDSIQELQEFLLSVMADATPSGEESFNEPPAEPTQ